MRGKAKTIVVLALPGVQLLDVAGPLDVLAEANCRIGQQAYRIIVAASQPGPVRSSSGVKLMPDWIIDRGLDASIDTLLIAGRPNAADTPAEVMVVDWLRRQAPKTRRYGSACSGAFFLAEAGASRWSACDDSFGCRRAVCATVSRRRR
jgi:transcriptional regulator GlxA family with amidase domain